MSAILGLGVIIWLLIVTYLLWKERLFRRKLFAQVDQPSLLGKLEQLLKEIDEARDREVVLAKNIKNLAIDNLKNIQKSSLLRYNPYQDVGGDQSFTLAMLNGVDTGIILTSLHTRAGTRVYSKVVVKGKSDIQLSKEEEQVLETANSQ